MHPAAPSPASTNTRPRPTTSPKRVNIPHVQLTPAHTPHRYRPARCADTTLDFTQTAAFSPTRACAWRDHPLTHHLKT